MQAALAPAQRDAFRAAAEATVGIDIAAYDAYGRDWRQPILGLGPRDARICIFGRDPGRSEVEHLQPFVGKGGQLVRSGLRAHLRSLDRSPPDRQTEDRADVFWLNTVPYKPVGNRAWSMTVKCRFQPLVAQLLTQTWKGPALGRQGARQQPGKAQSFPGQQDILPPRRVVALGREAFFWFGIGQPAATAASLRHFWDTGERRYTQILTIDYAAGEVVLPVLLAPLPHPSPANAVWAARFPALLAQRLELLYKK